MDYNYRKNRNKTEENLKRIAAYIDKHKPDKIELEYVVCFDDDYAHHIEPITFDTDKFLKALDFALTYNSCPLPYFNPSIVDTWNYYTDPSRFIPEKGLRAFNHESNIFHFDRIISVSALDQPDVPVLKLIYEEDEKGWIESNCFKLTYDRLSYRRCASLQEYYMYFLRHLYAKVVDIEDPNEKLSVSYSSYGKEEKIELTISARIIKEMLEDSLYVFERNKTFTENEWNSFIFPMANRYEWFEYPELRKLHEECDALKKDSGFYLLRVNDIKKDNKYID